MSVIDAVEKTVHRFRHGHDPVWDFVPIAPDWLITLRYCTICHPEPEPVPPKPWPVSGPSNDFQVFK